MTYGYEDSCKKPFRKISEHTVNKSTIEVKQIIYAFPL